MPSRLREQESFEPFPAVTIRSRPRVEKQKMSLSQTYRIATSARSKLGREASRADHNLRRLVGHANLLDSLMLELAEAERDQERWFNQTVQKAQKADEPRHVLWADTIVEEEDDEDADSDADSDSDSDSEYNEADFEVAVPLRRLKSPPVTIVSYSNDEEEDNELSDEEEDEEGFFDDMKDFPELALTRTASLNLEYLPPDLVDDTSDDDMSPPSSPPQPTLQFSFDEDEDDHNKNKHTLSPLERDAFLDHGFFIPQRQAPMIAMQA